jgi:hypothetical protein
LIQSKEALRVIENQAFRDKIDAARICYSNSSLEDFWGMNLSPTLVAKIEVVQVISALIEIFL